MTTANTMRIVHCVQGSPEWLSERAGRVTASRCSAVMATLKSGKESAERANYRIEVVTERLTAMATETFVSDDMRRGIDLEPLARTAYEFAADVDVQRIGMAIHRDIEDFSASPDGLVGDAGAIEIKCPRRTNHVRWALVGQVPDEHLWQCYAVMDVCEREWVDFVSYCPDMPKNMQVFKVRLHRDEAAITKMRAGVLQFLDEVQATIDDMEKIFGKVPSSRSAPDKSQLEAQLEASLGITDADVESVMRQQAERMFDRP